MRKSGGKTANQMPNRWQQVSIIAKENLKLATNPFDQRWRHSYAWEVMVLCEDTVCLLAGQKRLEDNYKDPDVLPKVNKADMTGMMEVIKGYLRSYHGVIRAPLTYIIMKTVII